LFHPGVHAFRYHTSGFCERQAGSAAISKNYSKKDDS